MSYSSSLGRFRSRGRRKDDGKGWMNSTSLSEALRPLASRMPRVVREHEILRVKGTLPGQDPKTVAELARREVLMWAQKRSGGRLPREAWKFQPFEFLSGGRNSSGVRVCNIDADLWAIRADDPDKTVAERVWTTEVVVGFAPDESPQFSARLLVSTPESDLTIEPHTPGFVQQVANRCALSRGGYTLRAEPWLINSSDDANRLVDMLVAPERELPLFVLTLPPDALAQSQPLLDANALSRAVLGIGHVAVVPQDFTWVLTDALGKQRSVFGGAVRAYLPGFTEDANPYAHKLVIGTHLSTSEAVVACSAWLRRLAASESIRRTRLGHDVLVFSAIRAASLQFGHEQLEQQGASEAELIKAMTERLKALELHVENDKASLDYFADEHQKAEDRAEVAELQARASAYRIQQLIEQLKSRGEVPDANLNMPGNWKDFADWCDTALAGRVVLTPAARRAVTAPEFSDVGMASRSLLWLANDGRDRRLKGGGTLREELIEEGVRNSHCGSDSFDVEWHGHRHDVAWHVKNGGNTRDPRRCLRIYYFWDEATQQIVVAEMPAHRRTDAT